MTGFGKAVRVYNNKKITAEVKSLNSKQLDFGVRTPQNYREIEMDLRNIVSQSLMRGKIDLFVYCEPIEGTATGTINIPMLQLYKAQIEEMAAELNLPQPEDSIAMRITCGATKDKPNMAGKAKNAVKRIILPKTLRWRS